MNAVSRGGWYRYQPMCAGDPREPRERDRRDHERRTRRVQRPMRFCAMRAVAGHRGDAHSLRSSSPFVNIQVRVMCRTSVSRLMSGGNARERRRHLDDLHRGGVEHRWPDERLISTFSTLPSLRIDTVSSRLP